MQKNFLILVTFAMLGDTATGIFCYLFDNYPYYYGWGGQWNGWKQWNQWPQYRPLYKPEQTFSGYPPLPSSAPPVLSTNIPTTPIPTTEKPYQATYNHKLIYTRGNNLLSRIANTNTCIASCRKIKGNIHPVCGSDGITYDNEAMIICAQKCGHYVSIKHVSACEQVNNNPSVQSVANQSVQSKNQLQFYSQK